MEIKTIEGFPKERGNYLYREINGRWRGTYVDCGRDKIFYFYAYLPHGVQHVKVEDYPHYLWSERLIDPVLPVEPVEIIIVKFEEEKNEGC